MMAARSIVGLVKYESKSSVTLKLSASQDYSIPAVCPAADLIERMGGAGWTLKDFDTAGGMSPSLPRFAGETSLHCDVFISVYDPVFPVSSFIESITDDTDRVSVHVYAEQLKAFLHHQFIFTLDLNHSSLQGFGNLHGKPPRMTTESLWVYPGWKKAVPNIFTSLKYEIAAFA
ncbi:hypothetical protein TIFTF001_053265 [Ficus carica]|uniref:Uncharacterized protein n=1 Tax=Ficus carica TaxID=3494 RepID=A0AA88EPM2_FICCA|nr:hypothetical protein TIFTF001_053265 [Ficus carica]